MSRLRGGLGLLPTGIATRGGARGIVPSWSIRGAIGPAAEFGGVF